MMWLCGSRRSPDAVSLAVVQLMRTHDLRYVSKAAVTAPDGTRRRWLDMECSEGEVGRETA